MEVRSCDGPGRWPAFQYFLLVGQASAADQAEKADAAKSKAGVLEEKASAKGEGDLGMQAVANVVMNRLRHKGFPKTICEVVKQGHEHGACQFSWWCDGKPDTAEEQEPYTLAKEIARKALNRQLEDRTDGALYYHHQGLTPSWSKQYIRTVEVGGHVFYKPDGGDAK